MSATQPPYQRLDGLVARAGTATDLPRTLVGALTVVAGFVLLPDVLVRTLLPDSWFDRFFYGTDAPGLLLRLFSFALPIWVMSMVLHRIHGRRLLSAAGEPARAGEAALHVFGAVGAVLLAINFAPPWTAEIDEIRRPLVWALWLAPALAALIVQVAAEELFFRGYLLQQLAAKSRMPIVWMGIPSLLFGLAHISSAENAFDSGLWVIWATALGIACADLTARHGSIGPAIGLHMAVNALGLLVFAERGGPLSGLALIVFPAEDKPLTSFADLLSPLGITIALMMVAHVAVLWLAARVAIRR